MEREWVQRKQSLFVLVYEELRMCRGDQMVRHTVSLRLVSGATCFSLVYEELRMCRGDQMVRHTSLGCVSKRKFALLNAN